MAKDWAFISADSRPRLLLTARSFIPVFPSKLAKFDDLSPDQNCLCDDLIAKLGRVNLTGDVADEHTRKGLWDRVFATWNTDNMTEPPAPKPTSRATVSHPRRSSTLARYLKKDLPGRRGNISAARKAGGKAYLKPNVTWDGFSIHYNLVDKNGAGIPSSSVVSRMRSHYVRQAREVPPLPMRVDWNHPVPNGRWKLSSILYETVVMLRRRPSRPSSSSAPAGCLLTLDRGC